MTFMNVALLHTQIVRSVFILIHSIVLISSFHIRMMVCLYSNGRSALKWKAFIFHLWIDTHIENTHHKSLHVLICGKDESFKFWALDTDEQCERTNDERMSVLHCVVSYLHTEIRTQSDTIHPSKSNANNGCKPFPDTDIHCDRNDACYNKKWRVFSFEFWRVFENDYIIQTANLCVAKLCR